jgi:fatty acid-binding protein DegV
VAYEDYTGISREELYAKLEAGNHRITTAGANVGTFMRVYQRAAKIAPEIVVVAMPSQMSVTTTCARNAIEMVEGVNVTVVETGLAGAGLGALALWAARAAKEGADRDTIVRGLEARMPKAATWSATRSNQILQVITARLTSDLEPVKDYTLALVQLENNRFFPFAGARDYTDSINQLIERMAAFFGDVPLHLCTTHARAAEPIAQLIAAARARFDCRTLDSFEAGPVAASAMGLGLISIGGCPAVV